MGFLSCHLPLPQLTAGKDRPPGFEPWPGGSYGETGSGWVFYSSSFPSGPVQFRHSPPLKRGDLTMTFDIRASRGGNPCKDCPDRYPACSGHCKKPEYLAYREE
jgi:hypothetical protein